ncbi:hypothetical protein [Natronococcus wangiae]|uniref:hypothetical protein n=1 Tax=Natronococcus wangiae TaxID=3068275 RepID=UPI00273DC1E3|nr:hypothetical protein [Natronococcus sp. AD5]
MSNPFDDLKEDDDSDDDLEGNGETVGDESTSGSVASEPEVTQETPPSSPDPNPGSQSTVTTERQSREPTPPSESGPAFEYSEVRQRPLYARSETWDDFEKTLRTSIAPSLAEEDVFDEETREIHDAVLRLAAAEPEQIAELVLEARRRSD